MKRLLILLFSLSYLAICADAHTLENEKTKLSGEYYSNNTSCKKVEDTPKHTITPKKLSSSIDFEGAFPLNVVVEEATGTWCGYCPRGIVMCEYIRDNYSDRIFPIAVHQGDKMEIDEYADFLSNVSTFPFAVVNRTEEMMISNEGADLLYNSIKDKLTYAQVSLSAKLENNVLQIDSETEFAVDTDNEHRLAYVVVEDNVGPYMQTNYYTPSDIDLGSWATAGSRVKCYFDNVARHIKTFGGIKGSLPNKIEAGEKYRNTTTIDLTYVGSPNCRVIGMIINYERGEIVNSRQCSVNTSEGIYINKGILNMLIGEQEQLTVFFNGTPIEDELATWTSSDEKVVSVSPNGNVEAVGEGMAVITVSYGSASAQCQVNVSMIGSTFEIDGIKYRITSENTCMVAIPEEGEYYMMEKIVIPSEIEVLDKKFEVNELEFSMERFVGTFLRSPNLTEIELPNTITYLPGDVFEYCQQLREFNVPSSVWFIDAYAFNGCTNLSNLTFNEGLRGLWTWSCAWCDNLKNIILPSTLEEMGREVFYGTHPYWIYSKALFPPSLQGDLFNSEFTTEDYSECALIVPESSISAYRESEYWNKFEMIVPDDVILSRYKLKMNPSDEFTLNVLNSDGMPVTWSSGNNEVATVDADGNVTAVSAGETTIKVECNGKIAECKIIVSYENQCVMYDGLWYEVKGTNTCVVINNLSQEMVYQLEEVTIPSEIFISGQRIEVNGVAQNAFSNCTDMRQITFSEPVQFLGAGSFWGCSGLSEIVLNEGLVEMEGFAFASCDNLKRIVLPSTLEIIGGEVFAGISPTHIQCKAAIPPAIDRDLFDVSSLSTAYTECVLIVPESSISAYRESECWNRFETVVPDDVILNRYKLKMNPGDTFTLNVLNSDGMPVTWSSGNNEVVTVDAEGNVKAISLGETTVRGEFEGKTAECMIKVSMEGMCDEVEGLWYRISDADSCEIIHPTDAEYYEFEKINVPSTVNLFGNEYLVTSIGSGAFRYAHNLKQVILPNTVTSIGDRSFEFCYKLEKVQLPQSLSSIGQNTFQGCGNLLGIDLPEHLSDIGIGAFGGCTSLEEIRIPENIIEIKWATFINCSNLKKVILPKKLEIIGLGAFESCTSLKEMVIPSSVRYMGFACFARTDLKKLEMEGNSIPEVTDDIFEDGDIQYEVCELFVPIELLEEYRNHSIFSKFSNIQGNSGVEEIKDEGQTYDVYTIQGILMERNVRDSNGIRSLSPGIYLLRYSDGKIRKIIVK